MKNLSRFVEIALVFILSAAVLAAQNVYETSKPVPVRSGLDQLLMKNWSQAKLAAPRAASDSVRVRRIYLDLLGRLPSAAEARKFVSDKTPDKADKLIDRLMDEKAFDDFWTLKLADRLRIKSEFPINLWPNAVYVYTKYLHDFWHNNRSFNELAQELISASGSNFRNPAVNFCRGTAKRTPEGLAEITAQTFWNLDLHKMSKFEQESLKSFFANVRYKSTKEWKEEIVYNELAPAAELSLPDGTGITVPANEDRRKYLADYIARDKDMRLAMGAANWIWYEIFGEGLLNPADQMNHETAPLESRVKILRYLAGELRKDHYKLRTLIRMIMKSALHQASSVPGKKANLETLRQRLAIYPLRRLEAEVLQDALRDLTRTKYSYHSVIPEPFTYLPADARTITLADGSISSNFLGLFGRPARDSGLLGERNNKITGEQRLYLFNSGDLWNRLRRVPSQSQFRRKRFPQIMTEMYWIFYSRAPLKSELKLLQDFYNNRPKKTRWMAMPEIVWILTNSSEFIYRH